MLCLYQQVSAGLHSVNLLASHTPVFVDAASARALDFNPTNANMRIQNFSKYSTKKNELQCSTVFDVEDFLKLKVVLN